VNTNIGRDGGIVDETENLAFALSDIARERGDRGGLG
jgi:hypothetical protein